MRRNKLITLAFVSILPFAMMACGGGDDDGGGTVDAATSTPDAPVNNTPDAMTSTMLESGLGQRCNDPSVCMDLTDPQCIGPQGGQGNCTITCGQTQDSMTLPENGDAVCAAAYKGATGTPACYLRISDTPPIDWYCGVLCGTIQGTALGECPAPLTCNLRMGQTFGDCN